MDARAIAPTAQRTVHVTHLSRAHPTERDADARDAATLLPELREALREGGCIAVICNTVNRAQTIFRAVQAAWAHEPDTVVALLHARFPYEDRAAIEAQIVRQFGKEGDSRPQRAIVVATQVIEQSLDLDFDAMVSDLAPIDFILQRLGRLHRHERTRPGPLARPGCYLFVPPVRDACPAFTRADKYVYDAHILLRTWLVLRERDHLDLPDEIEASIEKVYSEQSAPADLPPSLRHMWHETETAMSEEHAQEAQWAKDRYIHDPHAPVSLDVIMGTTLTEDHPEIHPARQALTRNADPSIAVICLSGTPEAPLLRPHGPPVDLHQLPDFAATRDFLLRSVTLSQRDVVKDLMARPLPDAWKKVPLLRNCRPLLFDDQGHAYAGEHLLSLDPALGIVITPIHASAPAANESD